MSALTLKELIVRLNAMPADSVLRPGIGPVDVKRHFDCVFTTAESSTAAEALKSVEAAYGVETVPRKVWEKDGPYKIDGSTLAFVETPDGTFPVAITTDTFTYSGPNGEEVVVLEDGKYTLMNTHGILTAWRHGEPWPAATNDLVGNKLVGALVAEIVRLKAKK